VWLVIEDQVGIGNRVIYVLATDAPQAEKLLGEGTFLCLVKDEVLVNEEGILVDGTLVDLTVQW
jgi:hypothetical protein